MTTAGMDVEEVRRLAVQLRQAAEWLQGTVTAIEGQVAHVGWVGYDADRFRQQWWPEHRATLTQAAEGLNGLAHRAENDAAQQTGASDVNGAGAASGIGGVVGTIGSAASSAFGSAASAVGAVAAGVGAGVAAGLRSAPGVLDGAGSLLKGINHQLQPIGTAMGLVNIADWPALRNPDLPVSRLMSDLAGDGRWKMLGDGMAAVGFAAGAYETYQTFASGDYYEGTLDAIETGVGGASNFIPGPAGYLTGTAAEIWTDNFRVGREIDWNPTDDDYYQYMNPFVAENWTQTILPGAADGLKDGLKMTVENLLP